MSDIDKKKIIEIYYKIKKFDDSNGFVCHTFSRRGLVGSVLAY